jgi:hypothetical protein
VTEARPDPLTDMPAILGRRVWLPFSTGALCLVAGAAIPIGTRRDQDASNAWPIDPCSVGA